MEGKTTAIMRQTWYEAARKNLEPADRLRFYELCFEFEFNHLEPDPDAGFAARLLFDMVRPDLEQDIKKAAEKAERARTNGARGGRPSTTQVNGFEVNPEKPSGLLSEAMTYTNTITNTPTIKETVSPDEESHCFFNVCLNFFERGCAKPVEQANTFWNYYASLGWKTKNGGQIVDRLALAKAWRLPEISKVAMRKRSGFADLLHLINPVEPMLIEEFSELIRDAKSQTVYLVFETPAPAELLELRYVKKMASWMPRDKDGNLYQLQYRAMTKPLE